MTATTEDSLLQCLLALGRYHGPPPTAESLCGGLPLEGGVLTPGLFERAASRIGLVSRIVHKSADQLEPALLPAIVVQEDQRACLLMGWDESGENAQVIYPELNEAAVSVTKAQLLDDAVGMSIVCRPRFRFDQRAPRAVTTNRGHWFWDAIRANAPIYRDEG